MIVTPNEFDYQWFESLGEQKKKQGNPGSKTRRTYKNITTAFDIETTRIKEIEQAAMYIWMYQFGDMFTVIGRTWAEFEEFQRRLKDILESQSMWLVTYVHNLSYEFQFLRGIYTFLPDEVFSVKPRKVLKCTMFNTFEFRCSYFHSNMSLDEYTRKMNVKHKKLSGEEFDYSIIRYPWTSLSNRELEYCCNDVIGLVEALETEMEHDGDNLYSIPLTSTGYVRRDAKRAMRQVSHSYLRSQLPDYELYKMCREAFRGGNTHANRFYVGDTVHNVHSADRSSSYPDTQCNCLFPVSAFYHAKDTLTLSDVTRLIFKRKKAVILRIAFSEIKLRRADWGCPYLSRDKCRHICGAIYDNGRILEAEYLETTITDIDLGIILDEYIFSDTNIIDCAYARYGPLPKPLIRETIKYYRTKTELKDVPGEEIQYMKAKNKLNSIYGMSAQDPVKQDIIFENDEFRIGNKPPEEILEKYNRRAFMCYQWGVWVTAWARLRLEEGIRLAHSGDAQFIYTDTDSVKYTGFIDWSEYNNERIEASKKSGAYATDKYGTTHYMGVFEMEHDMLEFRTLGAKKYVYREKPDSKLVATIAGVNKKKGGRELEEAGGIEAFKPGFIFRDAGGTESIYNDKPPITEYSIDGGTIEITSNVVIKDSTYRLGITGEYLALLETVNPYYGYIGLSRVNKI